MKLIQLRKITDPSHGWLEVPIQMYRDFCARMNWKATPFSYYWEEQGMVYLEEDCDASFFLEHVEHLEVKEKHYENCFVRDLGSIAELNDEELKR